MSDAVLDLDERLRAPLAGFHGERPPAPAWYETAIAETPERSVVSVEGADIETLAWGERGRPGLLLLHGGMANADWWAHIAPFFSGAYRVAALSMSGAGRSSWRDRYDVGQFAREMDAVAHAAGLCEIGRPVFVAHSFGSRPLIHAMADPQLAPSAGVILDAALWVQQPPRERGREPKAHRAYPSLNAALARFRLMPYQTCDNAFILDYIARQSLVEVGGEGVEPGWTWRFDPFFFPKIGGAEQSKAEAALRAARCPVALMYGERSAIVRPDNLAHTRAIAPDAIYAAIPDAAHHVFLDQPLATVAALRTLFETLGR